jgi:magnesium chelatase family protein
MLVKIFSGAVNGIEATTITLEVNILNGAKFIIVGLPDNAVKESQQRIDSALREIGSRIPGKRVIINMAPMSKRKALLMISHSVSVFWLPTNNSRPKGWRIL